MRVFKRVVCVVLTTLFLFVTNCFAECGMGDTGAEVYRVQVELLKQGYRVSKLDGKFGAETEQNIVSFQERCNLPVTGRVDKETYYSLLSRQNLPTEIRPRILRLFDIATQMLTTKYAWGGENSKGFDCSGFTQYCYGCIGVDLPRTADMQYEFGKFVRKDNLQPGDMVFFSTYEPGASHCGIYLGSGKFIHAGSSTGVAIAELANVYWKPRYVGACRVL